MDRLDNSIQCPLPRRYLRRWAAIVAFILALLTAQASPGAVGPDISLPPQGLYEGCAPGTALEECILRLTRIRSAGFRYVLNYSSWYGSPEEVLRYADAAAALGLNLIWPLNHPAWREQESLGSNYATLSEHRTTMGNQEFVSMAIDLVKAHPATWGFYIGDEVPRTEADEAAALSAMVRSLAPGQPQLYVARPGRALLEPFLPFVDIAGADTYPVGSKDPPVRQVASRVHELTRDAGIQSALVLQAFSWSQYYPASSPPRYPSSRTMKAMRDAAIRSAEPDLILWYSYQDILRSDAPQRRWNDLREAAFSPPGHSIQRPLIGDAQTAIYSVVRARHLPNPVLPARGGRPAGEDRRLDKRARRPRGQGHRPHLPSALPERRNHGSSSKPASQQGM